MGDIMKAISDDMEEYEELCRQFGEAVHYKNRSPDCYGEHAASLKKRVQQEKESRRLAIVNQSPEMQSMHSMLRELLGRLPKKTFARVTKADPALKKFWRENKGKR